MSVDAEHGIDIIPNSPIVRETYGLDDTTVRPAALGTAIVDTAIPYDAVWDCVTCGACVEACPVLIEHVDKIVGLRRNLVLEDSRFPQELTGAFRAMENQGNPWGQPASARLDWTKPLDVRGRDRRRGGGRRPAGRARGPLLGRLRGGLRPAQPEGGPRRRDLPPCRGRPVRGARPGGVVHRRPGPPHGQRLRLPDPRVRERRDARPLRDGGADDRHRLPALLQHDRQRVRPAGRRLPDRPSLDVPGRAARVGPAPDGAGGRRGLQRRAPAGQRDRPRLVLSRPLQRRGGRAARRARSGRRRRHRDGEVGAQHVLLRGRRRAHVDGGGPRDAHQRRADPAGARDGRRRRSRPPARSAW